MSSAGEIQIDDVYQHWLVFQKTTREFVKYADLAMEKLPIERAFRVHWSVSKFQLCFKLNLKAGNITRRVMLSTLSSSHDPLGLASSFVLRGRKILQDLSQEGLWWGETVSENYQRKWEYWKNDVIGLK